MRQQILSFATENPWLTFFTLATIVHLIRYVAMSFIDKEGARGLCISALIVGFVWGLQALGISSISTWINQIGSNNHIIYFLMLCAVNAGGVAIFKYNNPKAPATSNQPTTNP